MRCHSDSQRAACAALSVALCLGACGGEERATGATRARDPAPADDPEAVAALDEVRGDVRVKEAASAAFERASGRRSLRADDTVQAMEDGRGVVVFRETGARVELEPGTTLRVPAQARQVTRLRHLSGRLVARLDPGEEGRRVEVSLPPGTLVLEAPDDGGEAAGTVEARVEVTEARTEIAMVSGSGRVEREGARPIRIAPARFATITSAGEVLEEGVAAAPAVLLEPADGAALTTRGEVRFAWEAIDAITRYRLVVTPEGGAPIAREVQATSATLAIDGGAFTWTVRGLESGAATPSSAARRAHLTVDRTAPALTLRSPRGGESVRTPTILVAGTTEAGATLEIDGQPAAVSPEGRFAVEHPLPRGLVNIVVRAVDPLGNARIASRSVLRQ